LQMEGTLELKPRSLLFPKLIQQKKDQVNVAPHRECKINCVTWLFKSIYDLKLVQSIIATQILSSAEKWAIPMVESPSPSSS
jgi:hypothetical protein